MARLRLSRKTCSGIVAGVLVAGLHVVGQPARAVVIPGTNGKIVYETPTALATVNPDGTGLQTLLNTVAADNNPSWAPNGQFIVFNNGGDIFRTSPDGSVRVQITGPGGTLDVEPEVDPTSTIIVFETSGVAISTVPVAGGSPSAVPGSVVTDNDPTFSPNGQFIVVDSAAGIDRFNADGSGGRTTILGTMAGDQDPVVTPDGSKLLFEGAGATAIMTVPFPDGGPRTTFTNSVAADDHASPSPDGTAVVYDRAGALVSVPLPSGGSPTTIVATGANDSHWGPGPPLATNVAPSFTSSVCGQTVLVPAFGSATLGATVAIAALDSNTGQAITLASGVVPPWATFTSTPGNPATGSINANPGLFDWFGSLGGPPPIVTITATDNGTPPLTAQCAVTLRVRLFAGSPF